MTTHMVPETGITLSLLTHNVMMPVDTTIKQSGQDERAPACVGYWKDQDVVVLCEVGTERMHTYFTRRGREQGLSYATQPLRDTLKLPGGIMILSRFPILETGVMVFGDHATGMDALVAKGVVWVRVEKEGVRFHILGLHLQSGYHPLAKRAQRTQLSLLTRFIEQLHIPPDEPYFLLGDFNVDWHTETSLLSHVCRSTRVAEPLRHPQSSPYTIDPTVNNLVGLDEIHAARSEAYPHGCLDTYVKTGLCGCCPKEWVDYILPSVPHPTPSPPPYTIRTLGMTCLNQPLTSFRIRHEDLPRKHVWTPFASDHFPLHMQAHITVQQSPVWQRLRGSQEGQRGGYGNYRGYEDAISKKDIQPPVTQSLIPQAQSTPGQITTHPPSTASHLSPLREPDEPPIRFWDRYLHWMMLALTTAFFILFFMGSVLYVGTQFYSVSPQRYVIHHDSIRGSMDNSQKPW